MPPVGNDVVDLADPENVGKSGDDRFCRRVFNAAELALVAGSAQPDMVLWALWAAKEAAYKAVSRFDGSVCSIPRKYPVKPGKEFLDPMCCHVMRGVVETPAGDIPVRISIENDALHAIAAGTTAELERIVSRVELLFDPDADPARFARRILVEELARRLDCPQEELAVPKEETRPWPPYVTRRGVRLPVVVSLSHDGRFAAFAFASETLFVQEACSLSVPTNE